MNEISINKCFIRIISNKTISQTSSEYNNQKNTGAILMNQGKKKNVKIYD